MMKRVLCSTLVLGVASIFGLAGCGEESKVQDKQTVTSPTGTTTTTTETKVDSTGSNPPANSAGQTGKTGP
jgi:ABC-type uncharacterized transport system auxiliary subunit